MRILSASQIRELDAYTIANTPIESIDLMERACRAFMGWFVGLFNSDERVGIVCGTGNNGGDGLGIARMLREHGYQATCWIIRSTMPVTADFNTNLDRAQKAGVTLFEISGPCDAPFAGSTLLIDALFGSGLSRPAQGLYEWVIEEMNSAKARRVAVDIPSGLMADGPSSGPIVHADHTLTFQLPKLAFLLPQNAKYVGDWECVDIGLSRGFIRNAPSHFSYTREKSVRRLVRKRNRFDHKGTFGHALLITGSLGKMGAAVLAAQAAVRAGLGLLTAHIPRSGNAILQTSIPEAMVSLDRDDEVFSSSPALDTFSAVGIGPGLGRSNETTQALEFVLRHYRRPMVIDADALNILSEHKEMLALVPEGSILTPHPKEFERLVGKSADNFERLTSLREFAARTKCIVVLKGAYTAVADAGGKVYFNSTGNPGMAKGGSGDVLTGILTALLARSYYPLAAARLGVYVHGLAGDMAAAELGMEGMTATDLVKFLPASLLKLYRR